MKKIGVKCKVVNHNLDVDIEIYNTTEDKVMEELDAWLEPHPFDIHDLDITFIDIKA